MRGHRVQVKGLLTDMVSILCGYIGEAIPIDNYVSGPNFICWQAEFSPTK